MTHEIGFYSPKGGQGCTTVACATALFAAERDERVLVVDHAGGDCTSILAEYAIGSHSITVIDAAYDDGDYEDFDTVIYDFGTGDVPEQVEDRRMVVRNCYLALRRAMLRKDEPTGLIVVMESGRALDLIDVEDVLNMPADASVPVDPAISRAVDAGLLAVRRPAILTQACYTTGKVVA